MVADQPEKPEAVNLNFENQNITETKEPAVSQGFFAKIGEKLGIGGQKHTLGYVDAGAKGTKITNNIYFHFNSDKIQNKNNSLLELIVKELNNKPQLKILIEGHTDAIGGENINIDLSCRRSKNVKEALVSLGLNALRIEISCEGKERPLATNDDEIDGRELNRRVEFYLF
nr:OmpA family protein [Marivirga aurantiaca]